MKMYDRVVVQTGKYSGKQGEVVGVHGHELSVRVDGLPYVQVYGVQELSTVA